MDDDELLSRHYPVEENMRMQQRVWRFERAGWWCLVLMVLLALLGLFGNGPLSDATAISTDGRVQVEYQRLSRSGTTDNLRITVRGTSAEPVMVLLGGSLLREASIETLQPEPQASLSQGKALLLQLGTSRDGVATLYLTLRSEHVGMLEGVVRAGPSSTVRFSTFLYP
ncbi:hypothetical protein [Pseudomonas soli]|uniref:hypothetical protein n=1 Tax=Pseudomonas soli TaxID=1306993 RepID=UPI0003C7BB40|nr:hypothetical protein [Pseudomonas soli]AIN57657.1 hypothetical protein O165_004800 [Pseudomonas soli]MDW9403697.1 hypothetical protein [Pseudomonas soli]PYC45583.1 hypothetical protein DMX05_03685 [Pseudomonas soli]